MYCCYDDHTVSIRAAALCVKEDAFGTCLSSRHSITHFYLPYCVCGGMLWLGQEDGERWLLIYSIPDCCLHCYDHAMRVAALFRLVFYLLR